MAKRKRPLLHRAALHALKVLLRDHPRAALDAAGAGAGFVVREAVQQGAELVEHAAAEIGNRVQRVLHKPRERELDAAFLQTLSARDRRELARVVQRLAPPSG